jgi:hypothetical protein
LDIRSELCFRSRNPPVLLDVQVYGLFELGGGVLNEFTGNESILLGAIDSLLQRDKHGSVEVLETTVQDFIDKPGKVSEHLAFGNLRKQAWKSAHRVGQCFRLLAGE